ncbi:LuxR C-terminal-related transcriptional regulator [Streptomyces sp. NPDC003077]|uniref:helix-turn-helix transcriptional regulator n=1 Tax=Streptomyces sp. NPDC003077 TaxID=3154443 RepID=UPI00339FDD44
MPAALRTARRGRVRAGPGNAGRVGDLCGRLRELGGDTRTAETAVTTCLVWIADVLVDIAEGVGDARIADALVDEAAAVLASAPAPPASRAVPHRAAPAPRPSRAVPPPAAVPRPVPRHSRAAPPPRAAEPLTRRELAVLRALRREVPLRWIADDLFVSHNTVKSHARAVYRKLGAHSRAEALCRARERGLIP